MFECVANWYELHLKDPYSTNFQSIIFNPGAINYPRRYIYLFNIKYLAPTAKTFHLFGRRQEQSGSNAWLWGGVTHLGEVSVPWMDFSHH